MTDIPVYVLANFVVEDVAEYRLYEKGFFPLLKHHGGEFITYDDKTFTLEGESVKGRMVIFRFPHKEAAHAWYADPAYQALSKHRRVGTNLKFLTIVHGLLPRE